MWLHDVHSEIWEKNINMMLKYCDFAGPTVGADVLDTQSALSDSKNMPKCKRVRSTCFRPLPIQTPPVEAGHIRHYLTTGQTTKKSIHFLRVLEFSQNAEQIMKKRIFKNRKVKQETVHQ